MFLEIQALRVQISHLHEKSIFFFDSEYCVYDYDVYDYDYGLYPDVSNPNVFDLLIILMFVTLMLTAVTAEETDWSSFSAAGFLLIFVFFVFLHGFVLTFESSLF